MTEEARVVLERRTPSGIKRFVPILVWLPRYDRSWLKNDVLAGLSVWALMVPTSLGYATLSGVPVQNGLYAAAFGMIAFALFTTSRQLVQGPGSSTAPVLGAAVVSIAAAGSEDAVAVATAVVLVAGLLFVVMAVLKMGWIAEFLSAAVLTGFIFGVAINVVSGELFKVTGTEKSGSNTWEKLWNWFASLPDASGRHAGGRSSLAVVGLFALKFLAPKIPAELVAVVLGIAATLLFDLGDRGVELIAEVPRGLAAPSIPDLDLIVDNWETVISAAVGLVLIGFSVSTAGVRQYASKHNYRVDVDQELLAQGMSNVASSVFQGVFNNGSLSKSPVNDGAGATIAGLEPRAGGLHHLDPARPRTDLLRPARGDPRRDHHRSRHARDDGRRRDEAPARRQADRVRGGTRRPAGRDDVRDPRRRLHRRRTVADLARVRLGAAVDSRARQEAGNRCLPRPGAARRL